MRLFGWGFEIARMRHYRALGLRNHEWALAPQYTLYLWWLAVMFWRGE